MKDLDELVVNWHVTEACNFRCQYCYAHWNERGDGREIFHKPSRSEALIDQLWSFFCPENTANPLGKVLGWKGVRLNIAGGEPSLLGARLVQLTQSARNIGFTVSIISNGASRLTSEMVQLLAPNLSCLGISIDSTSVKTNFGIGRVDRKGVLAAPEAVAEKIELFRATNPGIRIKVNTVVNSLNAAEDLSPLIERIRPDRWKILRVLPVLGKKLEVTDHQFGDFVARHRAFSDVWCVEDNEAMSESYIMVSPHGRFFQNSPQSEGQGYVYSPPILEVGAAAAFDDQVFDHRRYCQRYNGEFSRELAA